ncbi:MAG: Bcr/CflA family efflux MFS transporter [Alphaproteobacteria bacterium]|nr:Bcr/CflA family efflux MFS transporter [Alphaproteobacteria bacterium]
MPFAARTPPHFATLVLATALSTLSLNLFLPSLPAIAADFQADYALVSLSVAGYLAATAVMQLIAGPLSDRYGRRPVLLRALGLFTLASLGCALAQDVWSFLGFRLAQSAVIAGYAVSLAVVRDVAPPQTAASRIGYITMAMAVAPMLGPLAGGALQELFGWRASFFAFAAMGAALWLACWVDLGETNRARSATVAAQLRSYPELLRARRFWGYAVCLAFSTGAFYAFLAGAPLVAATRFDLSPTLLGLCLGSITGGFMTGGYLSGRLGERVPLTGLMLTGRLIACGGLALGLGIVAAGVVHPLTLFGATLFVGLGNGLTMPAGNAGALSVRPHLAGSAAGVSGALTVAGGALLTALTTALLTPENGPHALLAMMLAASAVGLAAVLFVRRIDAAAARAGPVARPPSPPI